jgi:hypothetical protein
MEFIGVKAERLEFERVIAECLANYFCIKTHGHPQSETERY